MHSLMLVRSNWRQNASPTGLQSVDDLRGVCSRLVGGWCPSANLGQREDSRFVWIGCLINRS